MQLKVPSNKGLSAGFTLIEIMIVLAVGAVLAAMAIPSFNDYLQKNRVKRATEEIFGFITQAKAETVTRDRDIYVDIDAAAWCLGFIPDPDGATTCDCTASPATCVAPVGTTNVTQVVNGAEFPNVTITENFGGSLTFNHVRGTTNNGSLRITSGGWQLGLAVSNLTGRIRVCQPADTVSTKGIGGYPAC